METPIDGAGGATPSITRKVPISANDPAEPRPPPPWLIPCPIPMDPPRVPLVPCPTGGRKSLGANPSPAPIRFAPLSSRRTGCPGLGTGIPGSRLPRDAPGHSRREKNPPKVPFFCSAMGINERLWGKIRGKRDPGGRSAGAAAPTRGLPLSIDPAFPWDAEAHLDWEGATSTAPNSIGNGAVNPILASRRESGEGRMRTFQEPPPAGPEFPFHPRSRAPGAWKSGISDENGNNWI